MYSYWVYILQCADNSFYTGITHDLGARFKQHQEGKNRSSYTYKRRPVTLAFKSEFENVLEAIAFEKQIKGWSRAKKKALIDEDYKMLKILSECRNATHFKYKPTKNDSFND